MTTVVSIKFCSMCKVDKSFDEFPKNKARYDGLNQYCRECTVVRSREKYARNREKEIQRTRSYHLKNAEWSKEYQSNWHRKNRERRAAKVKERIQTDPEFKKYRQEQSRASESKRRAQKTATKVEHLTQKDFSELLAQHDNKCWICEQSLTTIHWDHVHPLSKGGSHTKENLRPACTPCNVRKNSLWPFTNEMKERIANEVRNLPTFEEVMP